MHDPATNYELPATTGESMNKIGIIFGMENTFPPAVVERINAMKVDGVSAEFVKVGGVKMATPSGYRVIIDRISQDIPFYRAYLKPYAGGGWKNVYKVHSPEEFFHYYNQTGDLCMTLQRGVEFEEYFRCYVIGQDQVHIMRYDPKSPFHERYVKGNPAASPKLK